MSQSPMPITPQDFAKKWTSTDEEPLVRLPRTAVKTVKVPDDARAFLTTTGLPRSAAPFLAFDSLAEGLRLVKDIYGRNSSPTVATYSVIGTDGAGNPICLNEQGHVILVDHEDMDTTTFMNSSVQRLAECLLAARAIYDMDDLPRKTLAGMFVKQIQSIDPPAMEEGSFWLAETNMFADDED